LTDPVFFGSQIIRIFYYLTESRCTRNSRQNRASPKYLKAVLPQMGFIWIRVVASQNVIAIPADSNRRDEDSFNTSS
jgi:hypothetical protein